MRLSLYLHFPFCKQKCMYCDFVSAPSSRETVSAYCNALCLEIRREALQYSNAEIDTVFFGGGTPSIVPAKEMEKVLKTLRESFCFLDDVEFTSEANPGTLREDWLEVMLRYGMNRLSFGIQSAQNRLLRKIGRIHTAEDAEKAIQLARWMGVNNLNADLMFGLPTQTMRDYLDSIEFVANLGVEHISAYSLILEEGTPLHRMVSLGKCSLPSEDAVSDMLDSSVEMLEAYGYHRYEISNFAQEGYRCQHNLGYWRGNWYLGLGVAAHSLLPDDQGKAFYLRRANTESIAEYLKGIEEKQETAIREVQSISQKEAMFETIMLSLRTADGLSGETFAKRFLIDFFQAYSNVVDSLVRDGLAEKVGQDLRLTRRGMEVQNLVILRFMEA